MSISKNNKLTLSMGILCFQGFGIRIFEGVMEGAIALWLIVLVILNGKYVKHVPLSYWMKMGAVIIAYCLFSIIKGVSVLPYLIVAWLSAAVVLTPYYLQQADFIHIMRRLTRFCMYYSLLHIPIMLFLKPWFTITNFGMSPKTFLYLFYFNNAEGIGGLNRIQGFCWEPSCWNLLLDLNLIFVLYFKEGRTKILLSILSIVSIMATTGIVVMGIILVVYFVLTFDIRKMFRSLFYAGLFAVVLAPFIYSELEKKLSEGSGNARTGDFAIAAAVIYSSPILGADLDNITKNVVAINARVNAWTSSGDYEGYMNQGMVNSFAALVVEWGILVTLVIFFLMFRNPLIANRKLKILYIVALLCVLMGTPIARTGFFYLYSMSTILLSRKKLA